MSALFQKISIFLDRHVTADRYRLLSFLLIIVVVSIIARIIPHIPNTAPIAALSLFIGANLKGWGKYLIPLAVMLVADTIVGFYNPAVMIAVYASFLTIVLIGEKIAASYRARTIFGGALLGSVLFFIVTNFAVWLFTGMYPLTLAGLALCFTLALPFFGYTLAGDLAWSGIFFGGYALYKKFFLSSAISQKSVGTVSRVQSL